MRARRRERVGRERAVEQRDEHVASRTGHDRASLEPDGWGASASAAATVARWTSDFTAETVVSSTSAISSYREPLQPAQDEGGALLLGSPGEQRPDPPLERGAAQAAPPGSGRVDGEHIGIAEASRGLLGAAGAVLAPAQLVQAVVRGNPVEERLEPSGRAGSEPAAWCSLRKTSCASSWARAASRTK